jgi:hypothetical protein
VLYCYASGVDDVLCSLDVCELIDIHDDDDDHYLFACPFDTRFYSSTYSIQIVAMFLILASN